MVLDEPLDQAIGIAAAPLIQIKSAPTFRKKSGASVQRLDRLKNRAPHFRANALFSPSDRLRPKPLCCPNKL